MTGKSASERLSVQGIELEVLRRGSGRPIVLLHGFDTVDPTAAFLDRLAAHGAILAPSAPGFGHSPRPKDFDTVYDLVHLYLAVLAAVAGGSLRVHVSAPAAIAPPSASEVRRHNAA